MISVILCGGSGSRLWPLSRSHYPKQFLNLSEDYSLLSATINRTEGCKRYYFVANEEHRFLVAEQKRTLNTKGPILLEPAGRNTAPAAAIAALQACADGFEDEAMIISPSDHLIPDKEAFRKTLIKAVQHAIEGFIVTLGIKPDRPETGFGYIKSSNPITDTNVTSWVIGFTEKPDKKKAADFVKSQNYFWNSGIYIVTPSKYLSLLKTYAPEVYFSAIGAFEGRESDQDFIRLERNTFISSPSISIDHAIMEPLCATIPESAVVIPYEDQWSDLGSWSSLWDVADKDHAGNAVIGDVITHETKNCYLHSSSRLISAVGINNLVVVDTSDAVLVTEKDNVQNVKYIVQKLEAEQRSEYIHHREVYRPWGKYDLIGAGMGYKVKQISVNPGASLSLQKHSHRAEHWIIVKGTAEVTKGRSSYLVQENESTFIPKGEIHSLSNPTEHELIIIEVQSGDYLGEDDIERIKDKYGRAT